MSITPGHRHPGNGGGIMKRWRVYQHQHARFEIGRSAGEYLESEYQDFKYRWTAGIAAWFYRGTSLAGLLTYTTEIVDLEA